MQGQPAVAETMTSPTGMSSLALLCCGEPTFAWRLSPLFAGLCFMACFLCPVAFVPPESGFVDLGQVVFEIGFPTFTHMELSWAVLAGPHRLPWGQPCCQGDHPHPEAGMAEMLLPALWIQSVGAGENFTFSARKLITIRLEWLTY